MGIFKKKTDKPKKKFSETKVGVFLKERAPNILDAVDDIFPPAKILTALIGNDVKLSEADKAMALKLMEKDIEEMKEITERWKADMESDSWLSKNARPLVLLSMVLMLFVFIILDSLAIKFEVNPDWISLYEMSLITTIGGYFAVRSIDKFKK
jgi:hypothetical protein